MQRPVRAGPVLKKRARERQHEQEKADKALGGAVLATADGEDAAARKTPHWYVELQWFRLLRGQARLNQIARILVELAPAKVFDPRDIYAQHVKEEENIKAALKGTDNEKGKSNKPMSKAERIIAANKLKQQKMAAANDAEKLRTLGTEASKLKTESGKLLMLLAILKKAVRNNNVVDVIDTMWEIEDVTKEVDPKEAKAAFKNYADVIKQASLVRTDRTALGGLNLVDFQLTSMSDRLPPLNLHSLNGKFKLDAWQLHVIDLVNKNKSILVAAPTSSGKTVLSSYVCTITGTRVLFVVPSEPLAWQVAAMLRALKVDVSIVVPTLTYVPAKFDVVVGTPHALESALTKQVGFDFDYAVFDEVHSLNNDDGPALQRLIRAIPTTCKVLALSATIGNAEELTSWWETIVGAGEIELVVHKSRFINLQRYVWSKPNATEGTSGLELLHPCAVLSVEYLTSEAYKSSDIAFTPVDAYGLYKSMDALVSGSSVDVSDLKPKKHFAELTKNTNGRISLMQAKEYEDLLKERLVQIAHQEPELCRLLLASLAPGADLKAIKKERKTMLEKPKEEIKAYDIETAKKWNATVQQAMSASESEDSTSKESLADLCFDLHKRERLPAIVFQLDSVRCQALFDGLLRELEEREVAKYPNYRTDLERQANGLERMREKAVKRAGKPSSEQDSIADQQEFGEAGGADAVDVDAPHPDFVLTPPGRGMGLVETRDVQDKLRDDLPGSEDQAHPLLRGLRRGIGMYIEGLPSAYHRLVQSFAQQGRLGVVFSDELLAYGVNAPFRSCVFFGDPGADWLTPLVHQQCAGRAGRRGLDREGTLVYAGFSPERLVTLLHGELPAVTGSWPLYPTISLQLDIQNRYEVSGAPLTEDRMGIVCSDPLELFLKNEQLKVDDYFDMSKQWVDHLGILNRETTWGYLVPELTWELRKVVPESIALQFMLEPLVEAFKERAVDSTMEVKQQVKLFLIFCRICATKPLSDEAVALSNESTDTASEGVLSWHRPLPFPHHKDETWDYWTDMIDESQELIKELDLPYKEEMLLPYHGQELDSLVYGAFVRNQIDPSLPTKVQHELRQRVWAIGEVLRITSNILGRAPELGPLQTVIRKSFVRLRYVLDETSQRNWKAIEEALNRVGSNAAAPPAAP